VLTLRRVEGVVDIDSGVVPGEFRGNAALRLQLRNDLGDMLAGQRNHEGQQVVVPAAAPIAFAGKPEGARQPVFRKGYRHVLHSDRQRAIGPARDDVGDCQDREIVEGPHGGDRAPVRAAMGRGIGIESSGKAAGAEEVVQRKGTVELRGEHHLLAAPGMFAGKNRLQAGWPESGPCIMVRGGGQSLTSCISASR